MLYLPKRNTPLPVTVVIRYAGERTLDVCRNIICEEIPENQCFIVEEYPFLNAVKETFRIGIKENRKYTAAIDADVFIRKHALRKLTMISEFFPRNLFELEGRIWDKMFMGPRGGGIHFYKTEHLHAALKCSNDYEDNHRPESFVIRQMRLKGYIHHRSRLVVGLHDFEQYYRDYFRKGISHIRKATKRANHYMSLWERMAAEDGDFKALVEGIKYRGNSTALAITDVRDISSQSEAIVAEIGLLEKRKLDAIDWNASLVSDMIRDMKIAPEYELIAISERKGRNDLMKENFKKVFLI